MLASHKMKLVEEVISTFTKEELFWLNGYIAGKFSITASQTEIVATTKSSINKLTITYGTETGNSKRLATDFASKAKQKHIHAKVIGMDQYRLADLAKEEYLLAVNAHTADVGSSLQT